MPIDFQPPQANINYQVPPPQSTDPLQTLAQMGQLRAQGLQQQGAQLGLQQEQLKTQQAQEDFNDQQKLRKVYSDWLQSGNTKTDDLVKQAAGAGVGPRTLFPLQQQLLEHRTKLATANELDFKNTVSKQAQTTQALNAVASASPDQRPAAWQTERQNLINSGYANPGDIPEAYPGDQAFEEFRHHNRTDAEELALAKEKREATSAAATTAGTQATTAKTQLETQQLKSQLDFMEGLTPKTLGDLVGASIDKTKYPDLYARAYNDASNARAMKKPELMQAAIDKYAAIASEQEKTISTETNPQVRQARTQQAVETARATAPIKIEMAGQLAGARADAAGLTEDDYNRAGEQYMRTGVMPATGRDSVTRGRIVKAGNQWARDNGLSPSDVITMQAAYAGDKDSLKKFQAQRDQIVSFEQTAQKNLDLFLGLASKIPDTGVPWLNTPIRKLDASIVGSENMAAVNAARQIANNEIAKVTSGGGLGGVLSDSARHEVEGYNPQNATFAQTKAVANILKQDMANRHGSMDATLSDIKARIGGGGAPAGANKTPAPGQRHFLNNREIVPKGGVWVYKDTGEKAQ